MFQAQNKKDSPPFVVLVYAERIQGIGDFRARLKVSVKRKDHNPSNSIESQVVSNNTLWLDKMLGRCRKALSSEHLR